VSRHVVGRYAAAGVLFGCCFPLFAWLVDLIGRGKTLSPAAIAQIHAATPLHAIIDCAPFVLGAMGYLVGSKQAALHRLAFFDALIGLPNRSWFLAELEAALAARQHAAVLFIDLDGFKVINDSLGHVAGDQLLATIAGRLQRCLGPSDTVARFGGDEFVALLSDCRGTEDAESCAGLMLDAVRWPVTIERRELVVSASIGIAAARAQPDESAPRDLLRAADVALYQAKRSGKARAVVFHGAMQMQAMQRLDWEMDLRQALHRQELLVHYQPQIDAERGVLVGMEALVRWRHPLRGLVSPADFIPLAEETGLIVPIGQWVLHAACRQFREWQSRFVLPPEAQLSVNLSARQIAHPSISVQIAGVLEATGMLPQHLCLEVTESIAMDDAPATRRTLAELRTLGLELAIDDFGTRYSSLARLHQLPVQILKIDSAFVMGLGVAQSANAIVQTVASLAGLLGMRAVAEGVETAEQLTALRAAGCTIAQGYYFSRPLPADEFERMLQATDEARRTAARESA
jgi:diguanylate cyclase (GGDEF)-like protein